MPLPRPVHTAYVHGQFALRRMVGVALVEKARYLLRQGHWPRIDQPRTLTEKIFARKLLHGHDPRYPVIADKVAVRDWVAERIGSEYLVPACAVYDYDDLDRLEVKPGQVIKCANRSGGVYFGSDERHQKSPGRLVARLRKDLDFDFASWTGEPWYRLIPKRVLVEQELSDASGRVPPDYKFFVYHGRVKTIQLHLDRFGDHRRAMFDRDWGFLPLGNAIPDALPPPPRQLQQMIEISETLAREFDFIRVDLYETDGQAVYFGELTLAPGSGLSRIEPSNFDVLFGRYW